MAQDKNVRFIRRGGRVIPIKMNKREKVAKAGNQATKIGLGVAAGAVATEAAGRGLKYAAAKGESKLNWSAKNDLSSTYFKKKKLIRSWNIPASKVGQAIGKKSKLIKKAGKIGIGLGALGIATNFFATRK